jgi:tripeptide aminopeptidase
LFGVGPVTGSTPFFERRLTGTNRPIGPTMTLDSTAAIDRLMRFLAVEGTTGHEAAISATVADELRAGGVPADAIRSDDARSRIPVPTEVGNLVVTLPGTRPGPRLLFSTHLDTVPLCAGARPKHDGDRIVPAGPTALGGDNRTGCAVLVTLAAELVRQKLPHPPLTLLFTVREESGLFGARHLDPAVLGGAVMGFNVDGRFVHEITTGATGAERWEVTVRGKASHAGVAPEKGISATAVVALAVADVFRGGWFGKVTKDGGSGTSNVGSVGGPDGRSAGEATNVVTDFAHVTGESRSHDPAFASAITAAYREAFESAAQQVTDDQGRPADVTFEARLDYYPFRLDESGPAVRRAFAAAERLGLTPRTKVGNGGLDANWLVRHGVPTVTFGAGQNGIHTVEEWVDVPEFERGCRMALSLATLE